MHPIDNYGRPLAILLAIVLIGFICLDQLQKSRQRRKKSELAKPTFDPAWYAKENAWRNYFAGRTEAPSINLVDNIWHSGIVRFENG